MTTLSTTIEWLWSPANSRRTNKDRTIYVAWTLHDSAQSHFLLLLFRTMLLRGRFVSNYKGWLWKDFYPLNIRSVQKKLTFATWLGQGHVLSLVSEGRGGEGREGRSGYIPMLTIVGEQQLTSFSFLCSGVFCLLGHVMGAFLDSRIRISNCCYIWQLVGFC